MIYINVILFPAPVSRDIKNEVVSNSTKLAPEKFVNIGKTIAIISSLRYFGVHNKDSFGFLYI